MAKNSRVGSLYYEIVLDPNKFAKGATRVTADQKRLAGIIKRENAAVAKDKSIKQRYDDERKFIKDLVMAKKVSVKQGIELTRMATREYERQKKVQDELLKKTQGLAGLWGKFKKVAGVIGNVTMAVYPLTVVFRKLMEIVRKVVDVMGKFVKAAADKKKQILTLTAVMGGNKLAATELRTELVAYAKATAFSVDQTMSMAASLKALGFQTQAIVPAIKKFGQLSFGDPEKMKLIAKAYSDVKALGKLQSKEVMQFANQGVALRGELMNRMSMNASELNKAIEQGRVSFEDVDKALQAIADRFGNTDTLGLQTATGQAEALGESLTQIMATLGEPIEGVATDVLSSINGFLDVMGDEQRIKSISRSFKTLSPVLGGVYDFFKTLPIAIDGATLALLTHDMAMAKVFGTQQEYNQALKEYNKFIDEFNNGEARMDQAARERARVSTLEKIAAIEMKAQGRADDAVKAAKARNRALELLMERKNALLTGDDTELRKLEQKIEYEKMLADMQEKYGESAGRRIAQQERELEILEEKMEKQKQIAEQQKKLKDMEDKEADRRKKQFEDALNIKLPTEMRQNSVEEWVYLKEKRDREKREATEERRHQDKLKADKDNVQAIIDGLKPSGQPQPQVNLV